MILDLTKIFLFSTIIMLVGCDLYDKNENLTIYRFGDNNNLSQYLYDNSKKTDVLISKQDIYKFSDINAYSNIRVEYKDARLEEGFFLVSLNYSERGYSHKSKNTYYYKNTIDPSVYKRKEIIIPNINNKLVYEYEGLELYIIDSESQYDYTTFKCTKIVTMVCKVSSFINENIRLEFHFKTNMDNYTNITIANDAINEVSTNIKKVL